MVAAMHPDLEALLAEADAAQVRQTRTPRPDSASVSALESHPANRRARRLQWDGDRPRAHHGADR